MNKLLYEFTPTSLSCPPPPSSFLKQMNGLGIECMLVLGLDMDYIQRETVKNNFNLVQRQVSLPLIAGRCSGSLDLSLFADQCPQHHFFSIMCFLLGRTTQKYDNEWLISFSFILIQIIDLNNIQLCNMYSAT